MRQHVWGRTGLEGSRFQIPRGDAPDLAAYLVLQMEFLAQAAAQLGNVEESHHWQERAGRLLQQMLDHFWRTDRFVARHSHSGAEIDCDSLLLFAPLLLGKRLPRSARISSTTSATFPKKRWRNTPASLGVTTGALPNTVAMTLTT